MALDSIDDLLVSEHQDALWELFHENSKVGRYDRHPTFALRPSDNAIVAMMNRLRRVKPYTDAPKVNLPTTLPDVVESLASLLRSRRSARAFDSAPITLDELAAVLALSYGITSDNDDTDFPRPFRIVPSGGALYPLELYVLAARIEGLEPGLYHFDSEDHSLDALRLGEDATGIAGSLVQQDLALGSAAICFVSAVLLRSTFKYGDRGYRFTLIEAGHLVQNAILTAHQLGLTTVPIGGYLDREVDRYLEIDGINESTIYVLLIGRS